LTAFIIESIKLLQEDPQDVTRHILLAMSRQLANATSPAFTPEIFEPPPFAVRVNSFLFFSLSCSLISALGAVLALQWVGNYDSGLNISSPEDRAAQRHFRYIGVEKWKMPEIIAALPLLLFVGLALFFLALADWLLHVHKGVAAVIITWLGSGILFFTVTTIIGMMYPSAPFRTPISKSMPLILGGMFASSRAFAHLVKSLEFKRKFQYLIRRDVGNDAPDKEEGKPMLIARVLLGVLGRLSLLVQSKPFSEREGEDIRADSKLTISSLLWVIKSTEVSQHSRVHFIELLKAFLALPHEQLFYKEVDDPSWAQIFTFLCTPYQPRKRRSDYPVGEHDEVLILIQAMSVLGNWTGGPIVQGFIGSLLQDPVDIISLSAKQARWKHTRRDNKEWQIFFLDAVKSLCVGIESLSPAVALRIVRTIAQEQKIAPQPIFNQALSELAD
jgi:hypothetical protein